MESSGKEVKQYKRMKICNEEKNTFGSAKSDDANGVEGIPSKLTKLSEALSFLEGLVDSAGKYGSVTKEFETLYAHSMQMRNVLSAIKHSLFKSNSNPARPSRDGLANEELKKTPSVIHIDSDEEDGEDQEETGQYSSSGHGACASQSCPHQSRTERSFVSANEELKKTPSVIHIDSDEEDGEDQDETGQYSSSGHGTCASQSFPHQSQTEFHKNKTKMLFYESSFEQAEVYSPRNDKIDHSNGAGEVNLQSNIQDQNAILEYVAKTIPFPVHLNQSDGVTIHEENGEIVDSQVVDNQDSDEHGGSSYDEELQHQSIGIENHLDSDSETLQRDGLEDLWNQMSLAKEYSKSAALTASTIKTGEECDHSYVLKDEIGLVCRICGIIQKSIEEIFDYQWMKGQRTTRTYLPESQNQDAKGRILLSGPKIPERDMLAAEIVIHPRHEKRMKPHQLEGFNFLVRNLVADPPGGCILAHAPGSGKTFMIISFIQSFLGKFPGERPLIVLPKGILSTWKREFQKWQVEELPLYDLYSAKANKRSQQLEVLKLWKENKSILFLGYQQFAKIVCGGAVSEIEAACQETLLEVPGLLIIDEGHTPRNDDTNVLYSLARVKTHRKVVLSGTLFQNHVKEVFNILKLVRPKFLKIDSSRVIVRRILSEVQISGIRRHFKADANAGFFELVEAALQNDDSTRKVAVIQDLREMTKSVLHYYKGDFLDELPGTIDFTVLLKLSKRQKVIIKKLGKFDKFKRTSMCSIAYIHPNLNDISENTGSDKGCNHQGRQIDNVIDKLNIMDGVKTNFFLNILSMCESVGEKLLVFGQYLLPLNFLERLTAKTKGWRAGKEMFMITGDSTCDQRESSMEQFNNSPDAKVLFGSIKACGEGISLVGASRIVILDVHLNPSVSRQAIGRAFRPGQTKKVYVYRLVAADSPEEEDHNTSFRKELTSKMWFEWNEFCGHQDFALREVDVQDYGDAFLECPHLVEDIKALYRR